MKIRRVVMGIVLGLLGTLLGANVATAKGSLLLKSKVEKIQTLLEVNAIDGWLLADKGGQNSTALHIVRPIGTMTRPWFCLIPVEGQPSLIVHEKDHVAFAHLPTIRWTYKDESDLPQLIAQTLKGKKTVAMEYDPNSGIPKLTQVDGGLVSLVQEAGTNITSSANLVQHIKSVWGSEGKVTHYVAVHHIKKSIEEAGLFIEKRLKAKTLVDEWTLYEFIKKRLKTRGLEKLEIVVASGINTAKSNYKNSPSQSRVIKKGDLLVLDIGGKESGKTLAMFARMSWCMFLGNAIPPRMMRAFESVVRARDEAIGFINTRISRRRGIKGFEVDQKIRQIFKKEGVLDHFHHSSGHSMDTELLGDGANLDDYQVRDTRQLVQDTGFALTPALYWSGDFGIRSVVGGHFGKKQLNVTGPLQRKIQVLNLQ